MAPNTCMHCNFFEIQCMIGEGGKKLSMVFNARFYLHSSQMNRAGSDSVLDLKKATGTRMNKCFSSN